MRHAVLSGSVLLLALGSASGVIAQQPGIGPHNPVLPTSGPHLRQGMWFTAGLGYASVDCRNGCRRGGPSGNLEIGWAVSPRLLLAAAVLGWTKADEIIRMTDGSLGLRVRFYPNLNIGFFFTGGFGVGLIRLSAGPESQGDPLNSTGYSFLGGVGCDFRIGPNLSLTPFANGSGIRTRIDGNHLSSDLWQLGLGVTVH